MSELGEIKRDGSREYIPLPGGWEIQTKGNGSSYRLLDKKSDERHNVLSADAPFIYDFVTRMAREVYEASAAKDAEIERLKMERDNARANSVSRGKMLIRLRDKLINVRDELDDQVDLVAFGSTNHADQFRDAVQELDSFKWDMIIREKDEDDLLSACAAARSRIAELERHRDDLQDCNSRTLERARRAEEEVGQLHARVGIGVTVGGGHIVYGSHEAIKRVQNIIMIDSTHPIEKEDVRRSLLRDVQAAEARIQRATSIIRGFVTEIRAYSSPECDDEGAPGAAELKEADAFLADMPAQPRVRHKKRGSTYHVVGRGDLQSAAPIEEGALLVAYRCEADGRLRFRPAVEFDDGRFEKIEIRDV